MSSLRIAFICSLVMLTLIDRPRSQEQTYPGVGASEFLGGSVPNGRRIAATGHVWVSDNGVFLNFNQPSAMVPMPVDISNLDPEKYRRLNEQCRALNQFSGGCRATIRGQAGTVAGRQAFFASDIEIVPDR